MEEILASIRRIIADDDHEPIRRAPARRPEAPQADAVGAHAGHADTGRSAPRRPDLVRQDALRNVIPHEDAPRQDALKAEALRPEPVRVAAARVDPVRYDLPHVAATLSGARQDQPRPSSVRDETGHPGSHRSAPVQPPRPAQVRVEPVRPDSVTVEMAQSESAPLESERFDASAASVPRLDAGRPAASRTERPQPAPRVDAWALDERPLRSEPRVFADDASPDFSDLYAVASAANPAAAAPASAAVTSPRAAEAEPARMSGSSIRPAPEPRPVRPSVAEPRRKDLLSPAVDAAVAAAFDSLGDVSALGGVSLPQQGRTVEDLVKEILRPMLKTWLDSHLPDIVERLVRAEIERVARNGR